MNTIHKQHLGLIDGIQELEMPEGAKIVLVGEQGPHRSWLHPTIWYEFTKPATGTETRKFRVIGTGQEISSVAVHIGSYQSTSGHVWHIYEGA